VTQRAPLILEILILTVFAKIVARRGTGPRPTNSRHVLRHGEGQALALRNWTCPRDVARGPVPRKPQQNNCTQRNCPRDVARGPVPRKPHSTTARGATISDT